jgi:hypothetical protein
MKEARGRVGFRAFSKLRVAFGSPTGHSKVSSRRRRAAASSNASFGSLCVRAHVHQVASNQGGVAIGGKGERKATRCVWLIRRNERDDICEGTIIAAPFLSGARLQWSVWAKGGVQGSYRVPLSLALCSAARRPGPRIDLRHRFVVVVSRPRNRRRRHERDVPRIPLPRQPRLRRVFILLLESRCLGRCVQEDSLTLL